MLKILYSEEELSRVRIQRVASREMETCRRANGDSSFDPISLIRYVLGTGATRGRLRRFIVSALKFILLTFRRMCASLEVERGWLGRDIRNSLWGRSWK